MTTLLQHLQEIMRIAEQAPDNDHHACNIHTQAIAALELLNHPIKGHLEAITSSPIVTDATHASDALIALGLANEPFADA